jgi:hypothetical protein
VTYHTCVLPRTPAYNTSPTHPCFPIPYPSTKMTLTIPQLTSKLTALKDLASAHSRLVHYYILLPIKTAITDADLFDAASTLLPTNHKPPYLDVEATAALLSRAKSQAFELVTWADFHLNKISYEPMEICSEPAFLGPYVNRMETELLQRVRLDLEEMLVLFNKVRHHNAVALKAKPQIKVYLQEGFDNVLELVPILLQFGEDRW